MKKYLLIIFISILIIPFAASAHPGRTNSEGCHTEKKTGNYHCHNNIAVTDIKPARTESRTEARSEAKTEIVQTTTQNTNVIAPVVPEVKKEKAKIQKAAPPASSKKETKSAPAKGFVCNGKKVCADIATCEEAYFQLNTCHLSDLDRDRDGVPCEVICGNSK